MSIEKNMNARIQHKHDIEQNWKKATNFIPKAGELIIYDPDENFGFARVKIGDGSTLVNNLPFINQDDAITYTEQTLTDDQKAQARANIGVVEINIVSDDEFLSWINDEKIIEPMASASGKIYTNNNNKIYIL